MTIERELTALAETALAEALQPYHEMRTIRDMLGSMLKEFKRKHKSMDDEIIECCDILEGTIDALSDNLPNLEKLREDLIEQLSEDGGNVEKYCGD